jgi:uncharacterized protein YqgC (DUF456 family)
MVNQVLKREGAAMNGEPQKLIGSVVSSFALGAVVMVVASLVGANVMERMTQTATNEITGSVRKPAEMRIIHSVTAPGPIIIRN